MRERKNVFAVESGKWSFDPGGDDEYLMNPRYCGEQHHTMRILAQCARGMTRCVRVAMRFIYSCAKKEQKREECYGQDADGDMESP